MHTKIPASTGLDRGRCHTFNVENSENDQKIKIKRFSLDTPIFYKSIFLVKIESHAKKMFLKNVLNQFKNILKSNHEFYIETMCSICSELTVRLLMPDLNQSGSFYN